jgi:uncharacterized protein YndB with AHSA1/START domain
MTRALPPVRRQMVVPVEAEVAFKIFTDDIGLWWPTGAGHSVFGQGSRAEFRDGKLIETGPDGQLADWGRVLDWEPPRRLRMTWHPGHPASDSTEVEVTFNEVGVGHTLVTLEHRGWHRLEHRAEYEQGWPYVLGLFADRAGPPAVDQPPTQPMWLALLHTPGPAVWPDGSVYANPDMRRHFEFIGRLKAAGVLVSAGPLGSDGDGMTVLKLDGPDQVAEYVRLAQEEDPSVVKGVLLVHARPWHVRVTG